MSPVGFSALSERGLREHNDDAYCAEQIGSYYLFALAEGLAGHPYGGLASRTALDALKNAVKNTTGTAQEMLVAGIRQAEADVRAESKTSPEHAGLVTTLIACLIDKKMVCTVLDTGGRNCLIITRNTIGNARTTAKARHLPGTPAAAVHAGPRFPLLSDMVSHVLGEPYRMKDMDFPEFVLEDEYLLLSSGGLTDYLDTSAIAEIVRNNKGSPDAACEALVQEAMKAGSERTITVILVKGNRGA